jgi:hypothetical protein
MNSSGLASRDCCGFEPFNPSQLTDCIAPMLDKVIDQTPILQDAQYFPRKFGHGRECDFLGSIGDRIAEEINFKQIAIFY